MISLKKLLFLALLLLLVVVAGCRPEQKRVVIDEIPFPGEVNSILVDASNVGVEVFPVNDKTGVVKLYAEKSSSTLDIFSVEVEEATLMVEAKKGSSFLNPNNFIVRILLPVKEYTSLKVKEDNSYSAQQIKVKEKLTTILARYYEINYRRRCLRGNKNGELLLLMSPES